MSTQKKNTTPTGGLLERLGKGSVLCAEGYLFELERRGYLKASAYVPEVVLDNPEAVKELHREFLKAGSDVILAFTYYAHRDKLKVIGREADLEKLNRQALQLAKEVADEGNALLAGNICNTWVYDPADKNKTSKTVREMYEEQVGWADDAGADFVIAETLDYLAEAEIALEVIKKHNLPAVITFSNTLYEDKTLDGYDIIEACKILHEKGADVVGLNCSVRPKTMLPLLKRLKKEVNGYTAALPVAYRTTDEHHMWDLQHNGRPSFPTALDPHTCTRDEMANFTKQANDIGIEYIGICCGGAPHHVRSMAEALGRTPESSRYSADIHLHGAFGDKDNVVKKHEDRDKKVHRDAKS